MQTTRVLQLALMIGLAVAVFSSCSYISETDAINDSVLLDGVTYSLNESGGGNYAIVSAIDPSLSSVTIPSEINNSGKTYEVRSISSTVFQDNAVVTSVTIEGNSHFQLETNQFARCSALETVVIGNGITEITDNAFVSCRALKEIYLPATLNSIGSSCFSGCSALSAINLQETNVQTIGSSAFEGCIGLAELDFDNNLKIISTGAFKGCTGLITLVLPSSIEVLGDSAFENCNNLTTITLGSDLTEIGMKAFVGTKITTLAIPAKTVSLGLSGATYNNAPFPTTLTSLAIDANNEKYACEDNMIVDKDSDTIVYAFKVEGNITLSKNVGPNAFYGQRMTTVTFTNDVTSIGDGAFAQCIYMTDLTIPGSVTYIGTSAFEGCVTISNLSLGEGLKTIGGFRGCKLITTVTLPSTIETIDDRAFYENKIRTINFPSSLKVIGKEAFYKCDQLKNVTLPDSLIEIGDSAFSGTGWKPTTLAFGINHQIKLGAKAIPCTKATSITLNDVVCDSEYDYGLIISKASCTVTLGPEFKLWKWENGLGLSLDGKTAYLKEPGNTADVIIPASVERIIGAGFQTATNGKIKWKITCEDPDATILLDSGVENIQECGVFRKSEYLTSVSLPNIVVNEGGTFRDCSALVYFHATSISSFQPNMFTKTKVTEVNLNGCKSIVGPLDENASTMTVLEIPSSLETAQFSSGTGYNFYDSFGELITFKQNGNALSETIQANKIAGKTFYSPNHDRNFYEVSENEVILITEKSTGNTYQKITMGDKNKYIDLVGSGQVYRILEGKIILTLQIEDDLCYMVIDKGFAKTVDAPTKEGYRFEGWYSDPEYTVIYDDSVPINDNKIIYAKFIIEQYTITFDTTGGSAITAITQDYDSDVVAPANPTKTGYTFAGWSAAIPAKMPVDGMTITASWTINQYTITFDTAGGSAITAITQDYNTSVTAPSAEPSKDGYRFVKWDSEIPASMPANDVIIKAVWAIVATVNENGKSIVTLDSETSSFIPAAETKEITVEIRENTAVKVENASDLIGKTVVSKVEPVSNSTGMSGTAYEFTFTADGTQYNGKIQVTLPYTKEAGKEPVVYYWNGSESTKMNVVSSTDTNVTFETDHNSMYVVASETPSKDDGLSFLLYFGLLMVVGIAVSMLVGFNFYRKKA